MTDTNKTVRDLELMRQFDGELDDDLSATVEDFVEADADARDKMAGLALVGQLMRERADADARADGIADRVMDALDRDDVETLDAEAEADQSAPLDSSSPASRERKRLNPKPANDNSGTIYAFAAVAAAIAAGVFVWGKTTSHDTIASAPEGKTGPTSMVASDSPAAADMRGPAVGADDSATAEEDDALGVEIAAVDFGSHSGSVFYVSSGSEEVTAVVWVTDLGDE